MLKIGAVPVAVVTLGVLVSADAETAVTSAPAAVTRTTLQTVDVSNSSYEAIFDLIDISPGKVARHTHPGPALVHVLEGGFRFLLDGHAPRMFKAGDSFQEPTGAGHEDSGTDRARSWWFLLFPRVRRWSRGRNSTMLISKAAHRLPNRGTFKRERGFDAAV